MAFDWMRRALLVLASGAALALAACGSSTIESQLTPTRIVAFGDGLGDLAQNGSRYTVNDGGLNIWTEMVAFDFGLPLVRSTLGGTSYATGNARVVAKPDAAGNAATPSVKDQVDAFLAGNSIASTDLIIISGGTSDVIAEMAKVTAGTQTADQMVANVRQAGRDLAAQARRLVDAGATHVVVVGTYNLGRTPWAASIGQTDLLTNASGRFNDDLLVSLVDQGNNMLYVDAALMFNLMVGTPSLYEMTNATDVVCTSVDPGPGIGIGTGQVNSSLCTTSTILPGANYLSYFYADAVYPAPTAHRKFAEYAYSRIRNRW
jgi:phospholipase/lecithinase/hemolysin